jgi:hypothetical protein
MKKILGSDEAKHHVCCMTDRKCVGTACMAWIQETINVSTPSPSTTLTVSKKKGSSAKAETVPLSTTVLQATNRGFCGMVSHKE